MICNVLRIFDLQEKKPRICEGLSCRLYNYFKIKNHSSVLGSTGLWNAKISVNTKYSLNLTIELN